MDRCRYVSCTRERCVLSHLQLFAQWLHAPYADNDRQLAAQCKLPKFWEGFRIVRIPKISVTSQIARARRENIDNIKLKLLRFYTEIFSKSLHEVTRKYNAIFKTDELKLCDKEHEKKVK